MPAVSGPGVAGASAPGSVPPSTPPIVAGACVRVTQVSSHGM